MSIDMAKKEISALRAKMNKSRASNEEIQHCMDRINELNRYIEEQTRKERTIVPI